MMARTDICLAPDTGQEQLNEPASPGVSRSPVLANRLIWDVDVFVDVKNRVNEVKRPRRRPAGV